MTDPSAWPPLRAVILDMDGVLVDSEPFIMDAATQMFAEKGARVCREDFQPFIGTGENKMIAGVAEKYGVPVDLPRDKPRTYGIYLELIRGKLQALPGVFEFIAACRQRGLKLAVASSADAVKVDANLGAVGLPPATFDAVVHGEEVARKKPAPDVFFKAAERLGVPTAACLVVEDAVAGVAAARAAGARCLALTTSFPADRLTQADWLAPNLAHFPAEIWGLAGGEA